MVIFPNSRT